VSTSFWRPSSPARPVEEYLLLAARLVRPIEGVPATAIVTAAIADGPVSTLSGSVPGGRAGRLQVDTISIQHH
jgi:hypothetical protein